MSLLPWAKITFSSALPAHEIVRLLQRVLPACCRRPQRAPEKPYFCGDLEPTAGWIRVQANVAAKARGVSPTLVGRIRPTGQGTVIEASISPSAPFWLGLLILCFLLAFVPIGVLTWLLSDSMKTGELVAFIFIPVIGAAMTSWLWGTLIVVHYVYRARYVSEFSRLLERLAERTPSE